MHQDFEALNRGFLNLIEMYTGCTGGELHEEPGFIWGYSTVEFPVFRGVYYTQLTEQELNSKIDAVRAFFREKERPGIWFVGANSRPETLTQKLESEGLPQVVELTGLVLDMKELGNYAAPEGIEIRKAEDEETLRDYATIYPLLFGEEDTSFIATVVSAELEAWSRGIGVLNRYVAYSDGKPVSAGATSSRGGYAQLDTLCTLPEMRNRGIGAALAAKALRAEQKGRAIVWAGPGAEKLYQRMGFVEVAKSPVYLIS